MNTQPQIVLGLGTGQSGFFELSNLLAQQPQTSVSIEEPPLLSWNSSEKRRLMEDRIRRWRKSRKGFRLACDIAAFYLPYVPDAMQATENLKCICIRADRASVIEGFARQLDSGNPVPTNHWSQDVELPWYADPFWDHAFPKYSERERHKAIGLYWDEYQTVSDDLFKRYPDQFRIWDKAALSTEAGVREILDFIGIPRGLQIQSVAEVDSTVPAIDITELDNPIPRFSNPMDPRRCVILVPFGHYIHQECDLALKELERRGYQVRRVGGYAAIDQGRNQMATDALRDGFMETLWIDSDIGFNPDDVERMRRHNLPICCGIYPQKGRLALASHIAMDMERITFGAEGGLVEILYAGAGFLHIRRDVYTRLQKSMEFPVCNERFKSPMIPFFQPMIRKIDDGSWYLAEDYAFCERARCAGFKVMADTSIRLWHIGNYRYGWEDAGMERPRFSSFTMGFRDGEKSEPEVRPPDVHQLKNLPGVYEWPHQRPDVPPPLDRNWILPFVRQALSDTVRVDSALIIEVGCWIGRTTRLLSDLAPNAIVLAIDDWTIPELFSRDEELCELEPVLFDTFLSECWDYRERILPIRGARQPILQRIAGTGVVPQVVFLDSTEEGSDFKMQLSTALASFTTATILGHRYDRPEVRVIVEEACQSKKARLDILGSVWRIAPR